MKIKKSELFRFVNEEIQRILGEEDFQRNPKTYEDLKEFIEAWDMSGSPKYDRWLRLPTAADKAVFLKQVFPTELRAFDRDVIEDWIERFYESEAHGDWIDGPSSPGDDWIG